jgi:hypothetical protein
MPFVIAKAAAAVVVTAASAAPVPVQPVQIIPPTYQRVCEYVTVARQGFLLDDVIAHELYCYNILASRM